MRIDAKSISQKNTLQTDSAALLSWF